MPWLPLYIDENDASILLEALNADPNVAFIVADGPGKWVAHGTIHGVEDGRFCLWHVPSGPLPLLSPSAETVEVEDPWSGWTELRAGANRTTPYFGAGHPGVIWWNKRTRSRSVAGGIGLSSFEWIGNHYRIIGSPAAPSTEAWWAGLRKFIRKQKAMRVPRSGPVDGDHPVIWALPSALTKIRAGLPRDNNP